ncbi:ankyrin repeat-containing domain protein [Aspergillus germanicus]
MPLNGLPPEIILLIVDFLDYVYETNSLARTNRTFYALLNPLLYTKHAQGDNNDQFALLWAASHGSEAAARKLLSAEVGMKPNLDALLLAATLGHEHLVTLLYEHGSVDINARGKNIWVGDEEYPYGENTESACEATPLVRAVMMGHERVVRVLLGLGADLNCVVPKRFPGCCTPMDLAAIRGNPSILELLIGEAQRKVMEERPGAAGSLTDQLEHCLDLAARRNVYDLVQVLLKAGARPSRTLTRVSGNQYGIAEGALRAKNMEFIKLLLAHGYVPTMVHLYRALLYGAVDKIPLLMQYVDFASLAGDDECSQGTVLAAAAACGNLALVKELIVSKGWQVDGPPVPNKETTRRGRGASGLMITQEGRSPSHPGIPLLWAAQCGQLAVVQFLLAQGANPWGARVHHRSGPMSSLAAAVRGGNAAIVLLLLDHGVDANAVHDRQSVLLDAIKNEAVFTVLLNHGAEINTRTAGDDNPLSSSVVEFGTGGVARLMCERGVDFNHETFIPDSGCDRTEYTLSLLELLARGNDISVLYALMEHGGFDPRPDSPNAGNALLEAVIARNIPYLRFLFDRGFDPRALRVESYLIFEAAALAPRPEAALILDMLLDEKGLDIDALDAGGQTPLLRSISRQINYEPRVETVGLLLSRGANPIFQFPDGQYPLMIDWTIWWDAEKIVQALCDAIESQNISFEKVEMQLLQAMETAVGPESKGVLRILRRVYWRRRYPVED